MDVGFGIWNIRSLYRAGLLVEGFNIRELNDVEVKEQSVFSELCAFQVRVDLLVNWDDGTQHGTSISMLFRLANLHHGLRVCCIKVSPTVKRKNKR